MYEFLQHEIQFFIFCLTTLFTLINPIGISPILIIMTERFSKKEKINKNDFLQILEKMNKYNVKNDCLDKAKHFSIIAKDSLGLFSKSAEKDKIINLIDSLSSRRK